jgi:hypothetical protein
MMDAELHCVPDAVREIQEAFLLVHIAGVDLPCHNMYSFLDPQQLCLQLCSTHGHNEREKRMQSIKSE